MKIGVLGSGEVAQTLGSGFLKHGHEVMLGSRDPSKLGSWQAANTKGRLGTFPEAARFGEIVALAVKGSARRGW
jgi:predicted dinucleotide-binding enzyme